MADATRHRQPRTWAAFTRRIKSFQLTSSGGDVGLYFVCTAFAELPAAVIIRAVANIAVSDLARLITSLLPLADFRDFGRFVAAPLRTTIAGQPPLQGRSPNAHTAGGG